MRSAILAISGLFAFAAIATADDKPLVIDWKNPPTGFIKPQRILQTLSAPSKTKVTPLCGIVRVGFTVNIDGSVSAVNVASSSGYDNTDADAVANISHSSFRPATKDGVPVAVYMEEASIFAFCPWNERPDYIDPTDRASQSGVITPARYDPSSPFTQVYPPIARWNWQEGTVMLQLIIGADGWVRDARIISSSGYAQLDAAGLVAVGYLHYLPTTKSGTPVFTSKIINMKFALNNLALQDAWHFGAEPPFANPPDRTDASEDASRFLLYPQMAQSSLQQGSVTLNILIRANGYVSDAKIIHSSGYPQLDSAALISVGYWNYPHTVKSGVAIDAWKTVTVRFTPKVSGSQPSANQVAPILPIPPELADNKTNEKTTNQSVPIKTNSSDEPSK